MNKRIGKYSIVAFAYLAVLYPLWIRFKNLNWALDFNLLLFNLFPMLGMAAFTLLWLHVLSGAFEPWLKKHFDFDRFVHNTSILIFIFIILHPLLLLIGLDFNFNELFLYGAKHIWFAIIAWILLITYDIGKVLQKYNFFTRNWKNILLISTIGFLLTFFHSIGLGSDLQSGTLRIIWIIYGITGIAAAIYVYGIKPFLLR